MTCHGVIRPAQTSALMALHLLPLPRAAIVTFPDDPADGRIIVTAPSRNDPRAWVISRDGTITHTTRQEANHP